MKKLLHAAALAIAMLAAAAPAYAQPISYTEVVDGVSLSRLVTPDKPLPVTGGGGGGGGASVTATASAPTYVEGSTTNNISSNLSGAIRMLCTSGCSGGAQFAEDAAHVSGDLGTLSLVIRKDVAAQVAGTDGDYSGLINDSTGRLWVHVGAVDGNVAVTGTFWQATQPVSGTVTANIGTVGTLATAAKQDLLFALFPATIGSKARASSLGVGFSTEDQALVTAVSTALTNLTGTKAPGTAAANSLLTGGVYNSTPPTLTNGQQAAFQFTSAGALITNAGAGLAQGSTTSGQTGGLTMGAVTTAAPTYTTAQTNAISLDVKGSTRVLLMDTTGTPLDPTAGSAVQCGATVGAMVQCALDNVNGSTGSTAPTRAQLMGAQSGANMVSVIQADASAAINVSTATTTQIVALSSSKKIYVTSLDVIAGGTGNITFVYGTGSACGTGTTSLTGAYNLTAQAGIAKGGGLGPVLVVPASNALCVTTSAAVQMSGSVAYTQF